MLFIPIPLEIAILERKIEIDLSCVITAGIRLLGIWEADTSVLDFLQNRVWTFSENQVGRTWFLLPVEPAKI